MAACRIDIENAIAEKAINDNFSESFDIEKINDNTFFIKSKNDISLISKEAEKEMIDDISNKIVADYDGNLTVHLSNDSIDGTTVTIGVSPSYSEKVLYDYETQKNSPINPKSEDLNEKEIEKIESKLSPIGKQNEPTNSEVSELLMKIGIDVKENGLKLENVKSLMQLMHDWNNKKSFTISQEDAIEFVKLMKTSFQKLYTDFLSKVTDTQTYKNLLKNLQKDKEYLNPDGKPNIIKIKEAAIANLLAQYNGNSTIEINETPSIVDRFRELWKVFSQFILRKINETGYNPFNKPEKKLELSYKNITGKVFKVLDSYTDEIRTNWEFENIFPNDRFTIGWDGNQFAIYRVEDVVNFSPKDFIENGKIKTIGQDAALKGLIKIADIPSLRTLKELIEHTQQKNDFDVKKYEDLNDFSNQQSQRLREEQKTEVKEAFESNPKLANSVYKALVPDGYTRLYRAENEKGVDSPAPDWLLEQPEMKAQKEAEGRWFYKTYEEAKYHASAFGSSDITYVDVPTNEVEKYNAKDNKFSGGYGKQGFEYFLPKELANQRKSFEEQKQIAEQIYSQYLDTTDNPRIEAFKEFVKNNVNKQFQKLTKEEKAKTVEQVTKEYRSITSLKDLAYKLANRIGLNVEFVNRTDVDWKGYMQGNKIVLNEAYMTPDTPFHEILAHPIIRALKKSKPELYQSLLKELETGKGKEIFEQVKRDYKYKDFDEIQHINEDILIVPDAGNTDKGRYYLTNENADDLGNYTLEEISKKYPQLKNNKYTLEEQQEEALVTLLGMMAADKLDAKKDATLISKLKELWKQISDFVKSLLRQDDIKIDELPIDNSNELTQQELNKLLKNGEITKKCD